MKGRYFVTPLLLLVLSCTQYPSEKIENDFGYIDVKICSTKTSISENVISFSENEELSLICEDVNSMTLSNTATESTSNFSGRYYKKGLSQSDAKWYSFYPNSLTNSSLGVVSGSLSYFQQAPFDPSANFMYSNIEIADYNEDSQPSLSLSMNQMMGLVKITFTNSSDTYKDDILQSVQLKSGSSILSGSFTFDINYLGHKPSFDATGRKSVYSIFSQETSLGKDTDHTIYLFVNPGTIDNAKLIIRTDKHTFTKDAANSFSCPQNQLTFFSNDFEITDFAVSEPTSLSRKIVFWGDSYTNRGLPEEYNYPFQLGKLLGPQWTISNQGVSGNTPLEILSRQGSLKVVVGENFTIPATATEVVNKIPIYWVKNEKWEDGYFPATKFYGSEINPVTICGVQCNISKTDDGYSIQRVSKGESVPVPQYSEIVPYSSREELRNADLTVVYMGGNPGWNDDVNVLLSQHKLATGFITNQPNYLALGFHNRSYLESQNYNAKFVAEYSNRFLNLRIPVKNDRSYWLVRTGVYAKASDIPQSELDAEWPVSFLYDSHHPNEYGAKAIAELIYNRMRELGYID